MTQTSMREHAVALASMGFRVFKLGVWGRIPAVENWPETATSDVDQVRRMWTCPLNGEELANNIGILTGTEAGDLMVLDVDRKNGARGDESLQRLIDIIGLDLDTYTVRTPTGGRHIYLRTKPGEEVRNSVSSRALGGGLDVRGWHGFVVGPGSETWRGRYEIERDAPIAMAPEWLVELCGRHVRRCPGAHAAALVALDAQADLERAVRYLEDEAPQAIMGAGGDHATYKVAARLGDMGVSESMALGLMLEHWNEKKAFPPWEVAPLEIKVGNAYQYRRDRLGVASPLIEFDDVSKEVSADALEALRGAAAGTHKGIELIPFDQIVLPTGDEEYLVEDLMSRRAMTIMWSKPGAGKSALALDLALCVATGRPWQDKAVEKGAAVYVAAEAVDDTVKRKVAWEKTFLIGGGMTEPTPPFYLIDSQLDLTKQAQELGDAIAATLERGRGENAPGLRLIVVDTMVKTLRGSIKDDEVVVPYLMAADTLRRRFGCATLVLHHCGWDDTRLMGASQIMADLDLEMALVREGHKLTVRIGKARSDDIEGTKLHWRTEKVGLEPTRKGKPRNAFVVLPVSAAEKDFEPAEAPPQAQQLFRHFKALVEAKMADELCQIKDAKFIWREISDYAKANWKENIRGKRRYSGANPEDPGVIVGNGRLRVLRHSLLQLGWIGKDEQDQWFIVERHSAL